MKHGAALGVAAVNCRRLGRAGPAQLLGCVTLKPLAEDAVVLLP